MVKVTIKDIDPSEIKRVITELSGSIIPLTAIFEALGYIGVTGIGWGILAGAITAIGIECGYAVRKVGNSIILEKQKKKSEQCPRNEAVEVTKK